MNSVVTVARVMRSRGWPAAAATRPRTDRRAGVGRIRPAALTGLLLLSGCASVPLEQGGSLSSYQDLAQSDGLITRARVRVAKDEILAAGTLRLVPTSFAAAAVDANLSEAQRKLVANAIDRSLCIGLSDRFRILSPAQPADLTVRAVITRIVPTDTTAAAASNAISLATTVVTATGVVTAPIPSLRLPIGLGGLALEVEALDRTGAQKAAMIWARGATAFAGRPRVATNGDAYDLAASFGDDFSQLMVTGTSPFGKLPSLPSPPSLQRLQSLLGGAPKESPCEAFGRSPGVPGLIGGAIGLPPDWTDKGAAQQVQAAR
jgi:hypothetical protein